MSKKTTHANGVSSGSLTQAEVDACVADLGRYATTVAGGSKPLSTQERKRMPRPRKDGASIAREIAQLAQKYGLTAIVDVQGMLDLVAQAEQLAPLDKVATNFSVTVHDRAFGAESASWKAATTAYTMLKRMARDNPDLARDLSGVTATLKHSVPSATATSGASAKTKKAKTKAGATAAAPEPEPASAPASAAEASVTATPPVPAKQ